MAKHSLLRSDGKAHPAPSADFGGAAARTCAPLLTLPPHAAGHCPIWRMCHTLCLCSTSIWSGFLWHKRTTTHTVHDCHTLCFGAALQGR